MRMHFHTHAFAEGVFDPQAGPTTQHSLLQYRQRWTAATAPIEPPLP